LCIRHHHVDSFAAAAATPTTTAIVQLGQLIDLGLTRVVGAFHLGKSEFAMPTSSANTNPWKRQSARTALRPPPHYCLPQFCLPVAPLRKKTRVRSIDHSLPMGPTRILL